MSDIDISKFADFAYSIDWWKVLVETFSLPDDVVEFIIETKYPHDIEVHYRAMHQRVVNDTKWETHLFEGMLTRELWEALHNAIGVEFPVQKIMIRLQATSWIEYTVQCCPPKEAMLKAVEAIVASKQKTTAVVGLLGREG